jgi:hypothetical protein
MDIVLKPKRVTRIFAFTVIYLTLAHIIGQSVAFYLGFKSRFKPVVSWLDLDAEQSIPTFYSSATLLFCSLLFAIVTIAKKKSGEQYVYWLGLALIFLFLSVDEALMVHELLIDKVRSTMRTSGIFYFAWVIPYSIALIIFLLVYVKFLYNLPSKTRILFIISGLIYVTGAIGIELIGGRYSELHGYNVTYFVITTIEELLEMTGIVILIYTLMSYIDSEFKDLRLSIKSS